MGPIATPRPVTAPHTPMAAARCRGSRNVSVMIASVVGKISADATPITSRMPISGPVEVHRAAPTLLSANRIRPAIRVPRRPNRSPTVPPASTSAANARL